MQNANPVTNANPALQSLHDISLPSQISLWPLAPGWWIVGLLLLVVMLLISRLTWKKHLILQQQKHFKLTIQNAEQTLISIEDDHAFKQQALILIQQTLQLITKDSAGKTGDELQLQLQQWLNPEQAHFLSHVRYQAQTENINRADYLNIIRQLNSAALLDNIKRSKQGASHE